MEQFTAALRATFARCGLSDLLDDNDGIPNMKSQVLLRRESGERLKIYDKTGGEKKRSDSSAKVIKR
jgi:hypothetical protein